MKVLLLTVCCFVFFASLQPITNSESDAIIASGQMPTIAIDKTGTIHMVFGTGDSLMYSSSKDKGQTFSSPSLISVLPKLAASHTRGPQLAITSDGLALTVCNSPGDIFSFTQNKAGNWRQGDRVNDTDTAARENLMALAADGMHAFAVWLDLRDGHNKIFGARSTDGGKTWSKNLLIYASPDSTVCECCKPSVAMKGNEVFVQFRNWLNGNRDLYLIHSTDGGKTFGQAQKLGKGNWPLKGCPMDGGGLAITGNNKVSTVWNRQGKIYSCEPNKEELQIGEGRSCAMDAVADKKLYSWIENGDVVVLKPQAGKEIFGKGQLPVIKAISNKNAICIWEQNKTIHRALISF